LRAGGGTRLKILEAMAYGRPVVSTRFGCEGLDVENGREVLLADRPEDLARAIVGALDNPVLCEGLRTRARALVERNYDWQQSAERLQTLHRRIAS
jgi:glycosyltransferase involved in cell wall biosynthesis